jgi:hypothetical protein
VLNWVVRCSHCFTVLSTAVCLLFSRSISDPGGTYNSVDYLVREYFRKTVHRPCAHKVDVIARTAYGVMMSFSDTQLVASIAILVAALIRLNNKTNSVYHCSIVTDLV